MLRRGLYCVAGLIQFCLDLLDPGPDPALRTQKADIASVAGLERFDLKFSRLGWVSFLLSPGFSAHAGGGKFKLRRLVKRLDLCLAL